jgi:hypothetical protein
MVLQGDTGKEKISVLGRYQTQDLQSLYGVLLPTVPKGILFPEEEEGEGKKRKGTGKEKKRKKGREQKKWYSGQKRKMRRYTIGFIVLSKFLFQFSTLRLEIQCVKWPPQHIIITHLQKLLAVGAKMEQVLDIGEVLRDDLLEVRGQG